MMGKIMKMNNNLFDAISAEVAKGELSERYLLAGSVFSIAYATPAIKDALAQAASESDCNASKILQAHFYCCDPMSMSTLFQDGASGEFNHDGIIVEFDIKLISSDNPIYRVFFKRLDAAALLKETKTQLRSLHERISALELASKQCQNQR